MSDKKDVGKSDLDPELDDLLDSALQDMTKPSQPAQPPSADAPQWNEEFMKEGAAQFEGNMAAILKCFAPATQLGPASGAPEAGNAAVTAGGQAGQGSEVPNMLNEDFIREAAAQFDSKMASILGNVSGVPDDQVTQEQIAMIFNKLSEAAAQVLRPGEAAPGAGEVSDPAVQDKADEVSAAISQTLQNLSTNAENLQTPFSDQDLANMFNFNPGEGGQDGNMFLPFMQGMMQSLLSKEVLYPSLKELVDKYPAWLAENKGKIDQTEYERFEKQQELMLKVCAELEPEQESDPEDVRRKRFEIVLDLMQKMQDLGQPPTELVGDMGVPPQGFAAPAGADPSQCVVM